MPAATPRRAYSGLQLAAQAFGGSVSAHAPVFSADERFLFCCAGHDVRVVSLATGETVRLLQAHTDVVTALAASPHNALQLFSASRDGTVRLWDYNDGVVLATYTVEHPVHHLAVRAAAERLVFVSTRPGNSSKASRVFEVAMKTPASPPHLVLRLPPVTALALASEGDTLVVISRKTLFVHRLTRSAGPVGDDDADDADDADGAAEAALRRYAFPNHLTALAVRKDAGCVAVGSVTGVITLSYCLRDEQRDRPVDTAMHWHAHRVCALAFSPTGDYLISGGLEAVLVIWQLATRQKNFLPRLGAPITTVAVSPRGTYYSAGHDDSSLHVVSSLNLHIKATVQGVKLVGLAGTSSRMNTGLTFEPRHNALVLNSTPGCLQLYHPVQDRHITEVEVVPRNRVSRGDKSRIGSAIVDHVAFSPTGAWMATVDRMEDTEVTVAESSTLKFWRLDESSQHYVLNTRVDSPHGSYEVTSLVFHPNGAMAVSAGNDKRFRVWRVQPSGGKTLSWACQSVGLYREYVSRDAALSSDGSLLAVAYAQTITLWDPFTNQLQQTLCHPPPDRPVLGVEFVRDSHYLVAYTRSHLYVWNLLTCTVWWILELRVASLAVDPSHERFAVLVRPQLTRHERRLRHYTPEGDALPAGDAATVDDDSETDDDDEDNEGDTGDDVASRKPRGSAVLLFSPASAVPLLRHTSDAALTAVAFVPELYGSKRQPLVHLVATDGLSTFVRLESQSQGDDVDDAQPAPVEPLESASAGRLTALFGSLATPSTPRQAPATQVVNPQTVPSVLAAPAHVIPAVHRIFDAFMDELLPETAAAVAAAPLPSETAMQVDAARDKDGDDDDDDGENSGVRLTSAAAPRPRAPVAAIEGEPGLHDVEAFLHKQDADLAFLKDVLRATPAAPVPATPVAPAPTKPGRRKTAQ